MAKYKTPQARTEELIDAALRLAEKCGYMNVTREALADSVGISEALVSYHLGTMKELRRKVVRAARERPVLRVLGQALAARDPHALKAPPELQQKALASLAG